MKSAPLRLRFDSFEMDEADARLIRNGEPIALPPKAFAVSCALARKLGGLVTKYEFLDAVWRHRARQPILPENRRQRAARPIRSRAIAHAIDLSEAGYGY